ncbi:MAG TPA: cupredoxin domain-containing protein [Burkholderiales bacterium]|nr:cupredoxin domain-containing protein [Burkholderiales bacterium]
MRALLRALWVGIAAAQPAAEIVVMHLIDDRFVPDRLTFKAGTLYRLRLENDGKEMHEFTAPEFFKSIDVKNPEVLEQGLPEILLHPGDRKDLYFIARQPGRYPLTCADHDWDGMVGEIGVE